MNQRRRGAGSALGRLERAYVKSLLKATATLGQPQQLRARTCPAGRQLSEQCLPRYESPTWRRTHNPSLGLEHLTRSRTPPHRSDLTPSPSGGKIEHQMTLEDLQNVNALFQEYENKGRRLLDMETFKCMMQRCMRSQTEDIKQIEQLFMKIDYEAMGRIQWDSFCTYLQLEYSKQADTLAQQQEVSFQLPALLQVLPFGGPVLRVLSMPDDTLAMIREDGTIYFWSPQLKLKRRKQHKRSSRKPRWVTDAVSMPQYNKLIVGTGNREIQLYEASNLEPYCQMSGLDTVPLRLDYCYEEPDKCLVLYGDDQGCVNILVLASVGELLRTWKKLPKVENIPNTSINNALISPNVSYVRWKVHGDWVTQLNYYDSMKTIVSSSNHEPTALVIGCTMGATYAKQKTKDIKDVGGNVKARRAQTFFGAPQRRAEGDQTVFHVYKGVKAFSFCERKNLLLTGGLDRIIRVWNPYLPGKPVGMLRSHIAPVLYVQASAEENKIFSVSSDNTVKIWDLDTHSCLFSASAKASGITGELGACLYLSHLRVLCVVTNAVALLHLRLRSPVEPRLVVSHREPVVCCRYNPVFRQAVSCSEASVVKVWDFETGRFLSEFTGAHGSAGITCLTFDSSGRRLVTGGRDGRLKIWSYNNGYCLHTLEHDEQQCEVCDCVYLEVNQNKCIIAVGWDRRINVYFDVPCDFHHFWKPQPLWQDDQNQGHKDDILCVTQCPPFLLATSSYDGEIIIWNVISGHVYCKLNTPSPSDGMEEGEGPDRSVSCLAFLKTRVAKRDRNAAAASLMANGPQGSLTFWRLSTGTCALADFAPSQSKARVSSIAVTAGDTLTFVADQDGFVHVYDIQEYGLQEAEPQPPKSVTFWRAHVATVTSLELIEEKFLLSASLDRTVRLWSTAGEPVGTFGQSKPWDIFSPDTWSYSRVPSEVLTSTQRKTTEPAPEGESPEPAPEGVGRMPAPEGEGPEPAPEREGPEPTPEGESPQPAPEEEGPAVCNGQAEGEKPEKTSNPPGDATEAETEKRDDLRPPRWPASDGSRLLLERLLPSPGHAWPSVYQALRYHELAGVSTLGEKPDLSLVGSDLFSFHVLTQEKEGTPTEG